MSSCYRYVTTDSPRPKRSLLGLGLSLVRHTATVPKLFCKAQVENADRVVIKNLAAAEVTRHYTPNRFEPVLTP